MTELKVDTSRYHIKALTAENYYMWSNKMEIVLRGKGLWGIVNGNETLPAAASAEVQSKFEQRCDVAVTNLLLSIDDSCLSAVISLRDPKEIWHTLKDMFKSTAEASIDAYLSQYQNMKMRTSEKVMQYVNRLRELENKLIEIGHTLSDKDKRRTLLKGLRPEFSVTAEVIRATEKNIGQAISMLVVHEASLEKGDDDEEISEKALTTQSSDKICYHCGRKGHTQDRCFHNPKSRSYRPQNRKNYRKSQGRKFSSRNSNSQNFNRENKPDGEIHVSFVARILTTNSSTSENFSKKWLIDSGASAHMCNDRTLFE